MNGGINRPPNSRERGVAPNFAGFNQVLEDFVNNRLPINRIQQLAPNIAVESRANTWVSSTTRSERNGTLVQIGEQALPIEVARQFGWGAETQEQQYLVKFAHEYAHVVQEEFDTRLVKWLDGSSDIPEEFIPYIQLYAELSKIGGLHGLSQMDVYHEQSRTTGNLSVPTYEDMAETIGSYLLGNEYFLHRLQNARVSISQEQAEALIDHVVAVVKTWEKRKGG